MAEAEFPELFPTLTQGKICRVLLCCCNPC